MARRDSVREVETQRRFLCDLCGAAVVICTPCDRGQRYCGRACAQAARRENQRASNRRYQAKERGRRLHRDRQARYRARQFQSRSRPRVTEQGPRRAASRPFKPGTVRQTPCCPVCGAPRAQFLRLDFKSEPFKRLRRSPHQTRGLRPQGSFTKGALSDRQNRALSDRR